MFSNVVANAKASLETIKVEIKEFGKLIPASNHKRIESSCEQLEKSFEKLSQLAKDYGK